LNLERQLFSLTQPELQREKGLKQKSSLSFPLPLFRELKS